MKRDGNTKSQLGIKVRNHGSNNEEWEITVFFSSIIRFWYSLIGLIFSSIFITFDFSCNESCDQFYSRINRFHSFFVFCLVIDAMTIMYSIIFCCCSAFDNIPFASAFKFQEETGGITDEEGQRETEVEEEKGETEEKVETEGKVEKVEENRETYVKGITEGKEAESEV